MAIEKCQRPGCEGIIVDGVCEDCGRPPIGKSLLGGMTESTVNPIEPVSKYAGTTGSARTGSKRSTSRSSRTAGTSSRRSKLGGGLVILPEQQSQDPIKLILEKPEVPEKRRYCPNCDGKVSRIKGFCPKCGNEYNFEPALKAGDVVAGKFEIRGPIAFGGLGWIYLAYDNILSRWVVLKGLLNAKDEASAAAAVAERQFLAAVKHPKIVGIYDFIQQGSEGYIVMEYVGGRTVQSIRKERGVLPVEEAISYILGILPAFTYLHQHGIVYCDFKPDNVMVEGDDVKLVDMGGVRRLNDPDGDIFGTKGYMAPEASDNPVEVSDLYTIGRALAVLIMDFNYQTTYEHSLPLPTEQPVLKDNEALYRFLLRATHDDVDARFQSAEEMYNQLYGVLREIVALKSTPVQIESHVFTVDNLLDASDIKACEQLKVKLLPNLKMDVLDAGANDLLSVSSLMDLDKRIAALVLLADKYKGNSVEVRLRLADAYIQAEKFDEAEKLLSKLALEDEFDCRASWYKGKLLLAQNKGKEAKKEFDRVYFEMPGEIAPKLAIAYCAEQSGGLEEAISFYNRVARVDPNNTTACFGLSRCLTKEKDIERAAKALNLVPASHSLYNESRIALAKLLMLEENNLTQPLLEQLAHTVSTITSEGATVHKLTAKVLQTAVKMLQSKKLQQSSSYNLLGHKLVEYELRIGAEAEFRKAAHYAATAEEKIDLVNHANEVRPITLF